MNVVIRSAQVSDHEQLTLLFDDLDRLHRDNAPWLLQKPERAPRPKTWLERRLADPRSAIFVADADQCVGLATVQLRDAPPFAVFIPQRSAAIDLSTNAGHAQLSNRAASRKISRRAGNIRAGSLSSQRCRTATLGY